MNNHLFAKFQLYFAVAVCTLVFTATITKESDHALRSPASSILGMSCLDLATSFLNHSYKETHVKGALSKLFSFDRFEYKKFALYRSHYSKNPGLAEKSLEELKQIESSEEIMAILEIHSRSQLIDQERLMSLSTLQKNRLARKSSGKNIFKPRTKHDLDNFLTQIFALTHDKSIKAFGLNDSEKIFKQVVLDDLAALGLEKTMQQYGLLKTKGPWALYHQFISHPVTNGMKVILFNLSVIHGYPPFYLPKIGRMELSPQLATKILDEGFEKNYDEIVTELGIQKYKYTLYPILKKRYQIGVGILFMGYLAYQKRSFISSMGDKMKQYMDEEEKIKLAMADAGISDEIIPGSLVLSDEAKGLSSECRAFFECLLLISDTKSDIPSSEDKFYKICKRETDPEHLCKESVLKYLK